MSVFKKYVLPRLVGKRGADMLAKLTNEEFLDKLDSIDSLSLGGATNSGAYVNENTAMRAAPVYTAVRILSEVIGMLPCHLMRVETTDKGITQTMKATEHPLFNVLYRKPNPWQTAFEFWRFVITSLLLRGNFYAYITRDGNNRARELIPIHPDKIRIIVNDDFTLWYEYTKKNGGKMLLKEGECMHIRALGTDGIEGMSVIRQARESIGINIQGEKHIAKVFSNGARVGIILSHPEIVEDEVADRIKKSFTDAYAGVENSHKTVLLEEGIKIDKIGMTSEDLQFIDIRKFTRSEILALFGIPPHMAGDTEKTTSWGTGIEQQTIGFVTFVLMPWLVNIEQSIWRDLLTEKERKDYYAKFNSDAIIRGDLKSRYQAHEIGLKNKFLVVNEVRDMENRNPVDWGDEPNEEKPDPAAKPPAEGDDADTAATEDEK